MYTVTIRFNEFKRNKLHVSSVMIVTQKMFGYRGGLRAVSMFVNRSAMFIEAVFTFGFSYVLGLLWDLKSPKVALSRLKSP